MPQQALEPSSPRSWARSFRPKEVAILLAPQAAQSALVGALSPQHGELKFKHSCGASSPRDYELLHTSPHPHISCIMARQVHISPPPFTKRPLKMSLSMAHEQALMPISQQIALTQCYVTQQHPCPSLSDWPSQSPRRIFRKRQNVQPQNGSS